MFRTAKFKTDKEGKFTLTKELYFKMIPLEAPVHVGMNAFPHLYIQIVDIEGEFVKILWDFSSTKKLPSKPILSDYTWAYEYIISANLVSRKKSVIRFIEYQKNETVLAIQL